MIKLLYFTFLKNKQKNPRSIICIHKKILKERELMNISKPSWMETNIQSPHIGITVKRSFHD